MKAKIAHIETVTGTPLCKLGMILEREGVTCGHTSIAAAKRTVKELQAHGHRVKAVRGGCPA